MTDVVQAGPLVVQLAARRVFVNGSEVVFRNATRKQRSCRMLACLTKRAGEAVPYEELAQDVLDGSGIVGLYEMKNLLQIRTRLVTRLGAPCERLVRIIPGWGMCLDMEVS